LPQGWFRKARSTAIGIMNEQPQGETTMRRGFTLPAPLVALAACLAAAPSVQAQDSAIFRHSADFFKFDGTEFVTGTTAVSGANPTTPGTPDGALFYRKRVAVPKTSTILYVSIFATGDSHNGAALWLSCRVNLAFCRPSPARAVDKAPSGWIALLKLPQAVPPVTATNNCNDGGGGTADCHDNGVAYQWCVPVRGGSTVQVDLKMATSKAGSDVFIEKGHVYIDSSRIVQPDRCLQSPQPVGAALKAAGAQEEVAGSTTQEERK
jgi:hypothetical protein